MAITLTGDYGYDQYRTSNLTETEIDASTASWIVSNTGDNLNLYPVLVTDSDSVVLSGGVVDGEVPLDLDWEDAYINSAAVFARDSDAVTFRDWTISEAWDGIRITGEDDATFTVENVWMSNIRDDGIENDRGLSGTVSDVLMDGVFVGISLYESDTNDQTDQTVTFDNVLMRMESFEYKGEATHQPFFKFEDGVSPQLSIHDSVFAIDIVDHREWGRLQDAWDSVSESTGNYFLNLSDTPLPDDYPRPPEGFTVLEGAEAREFWEESRADWLAEFRGIGEIAEPEDEELEPESDPEPEIDPEPELVLEPEIVPEPVLDTEPELVLEPGLVLEPEPEPEPDSEPDVKAPKGKGGSKNIIEKMVDAILSVFRGGGNGKKSIEETETEKAKLSSDDDDAPEVLMTRIYVSELPPDDMEEDEDVESPFLF